MKKKIWIWIGGLLLALMVVSVVGATAAYAQDAADLSLHGRGPGGGRGHGLRGVGLEAAAKALNMTTDELTSALRSGSTLQELADEAGVDIEEVQSAIQTARRTEMRDQIQQALTDGTISQEKADWLLEGLDKGFLDGRGFGFGFGLHGPKFDSVPSTQPTP